MADFLKAVDKTLKHEGGFVHVQATGEVANRGITHWTLRRIGWPGMQHDAPVSRSASPEEIEIVKALTPEATMAIYETYYWNPNRLTEIQDQVLAAKTFDLHVNTGQGVRMLQQAVNRIVPLAHLATDNIMGPKTLREANALHPAALLAELRTVARQRYESLAATKPVLAVNLPGWLARLDA